MSTEVPLVAEAPQPIRRTMRIWPAVPLVLFLIAVKIVQPLVENWTPPMFMALIFGPMIVSGLIALWWLFASRARWSDRLLGLVGLAILGAAFFFLSDQSMRGMPLMSFVLPAVFIAFTVGVLVCSRWGSRTAAVVGLVGVAATLGYWDLMRYDGMWGDFKSVMHWRWEKSPEDEFLAALPAKPAAPAEKTSEPLGKVAWPQFRGPNRDGSVPGVVLDADWKGRAPKEIWRHKVGPGWSSFSAAGNRLFTQEQRGKNEDVVCYDLKTGEERWVNEEPVRFAEAMGGVGPRATPTLAGGLLYAQGATGILKCLDPLTGAEKWRRDIELESKRSSVPVWGFSASPLVVGDTVIVYAGGADALGLLTYEAQTGKPLWTAASGTNSYSSPQLATLAGHKVVLMLTDTGLNAVDAQTGKSAWNYDWDNQKQHRIVQPLLVGASDVVLGTGMGGSQLGTRRVQVVADKGDAVKFEDRWTSTDMKPDFNDYVAFDGYLYGLDHNILCCVDLATGAKKWKSGRYGNGQILLLPEAGQLLVLSETGELVLIRANPSKLEELARQKVIDGKTWNHPVLVGNRVFVRNAEEAASFELPLAGQSSGDRTKPAPKEL